MRQLIFYMYAVQPGSNRVQVERENQHVPKGDLAVSTGLIAPWRVRCGYLFVRSPNDLPIELYNKAISQATVHGSCRLHLIHACGISPDSENVQLHVCKVQVSFLRRMLNLHSPLIAPLFTETGIVPLHVRRLLLVPSHLR
jgi:hypothetical protein